MSWTGWSALSAVLVALIAFAALVYIARPMGEVCRDIVRLGRSFRVVARIAKVFSLEMEAGDIHNDAAPNPDNKGARPVRPPDAGS